MVACCLVCVKALTVSYEEGRFCFVSSRFGEIIGCVMGEQGECVVCHVCRLHNV